MTGDAYRPLDLTAYRTAGVELLRSPDPRLLGRQSLQGLPFEIGERFVTPQHRPVSIAIDQPAAHVIVAHRLLESGLESGGPLGVLVAEYVFRLADGSEHRVPIRERFEIGDLATWGQRPFLAMPDTPPRVVERWSGRWSDAGRRQTEVEGELRARVLPVVLA